MKWLWGKIIAMVLVLLIGSYNYEPVQAREFSAKEIAHRGLVSAAPENTVSSVLLAANKRVKYAEIDVQETKDGYVVLMHDRSLKRVAGINKCIGNMDYADLENIDIGRHYSKKFKGERIPTLENVITRSKGKINLVIEIKSYGREKDLTEKVVALIRKNDFQNECIVTSFNYNILEYVKTLDPNIRTSYIVCSKVKNVSSKYVDIYSVKKNYVDERLINRIHKNKKQIDVWTVDKNSEIGKFIKYKVDYVITDNL